MNKHHTVTGIRFEVDQMILTIDGTKRCYSLEKISPVLKNASEKDRYNFMISPSGYGIHWPVLDEDLSVDGLLGTVHQPNIKSKVSKISNTY